MKKLVNAVNDFNHGKSADREKIVIAYVCAQPETETEKLYKNIVFSVIHNPSIMLQTNMFKDTLEALEECMPYAATDRYLEIIDIQEMIHFLRNIKHFKYNAIEVRFDDILREIIEPEKVHKIKKIMDEVDNLMNKDIDVISFTK